MISNWITRIVQGRKDTMGQRGGQLLNLLIETSGRSISQLAG